MLFSILSKVAVITVVVIMCIMCIMILAVWMFAVPIFIELVCESTSEMIDKFKNRGK